MFGLASGVYQNYIATQQLNVLLIGCEGVGKTSLLERLKVTQFSSRPNKKVPTKPQSTIKRNLSCPGPLRYNNSNNIKDDSDDEEDDAITDSSSERVQPSQRWVHNNKEVEDTIVTGGTVASINDEDTATQESSSSTTTTTKDVPPVIDKKEYDLKSGYNMLPMNKIRPTMGQNLAKIPISGARCHVFDISGKFQDLWERYYSDAEAVIFCWKFSEEDEVQRKVLEQVRKKIPDDVPFLIFGHTFDFSPQELPTSTEYFLPNYHSNVVQFYCGSAKSGKGVKEAMEWLIPLAKRHAKLRASTPSKV
mmetsp:Transcript_23453/g.25853  ORF Transcript_23453/g.25853 Transcript_23453/m.25853 type:complete len:306 (+) Transcript_23453:161-1078(+)|eukprot:CAMPEP_0194137072 /NCGR_PEP_ID=MMETSP0152-20130528/6986_1 /TAXON_ID=1049557 /ORGANISM="Thalassiothrix antarctica, Strain L6-D1" /LENGTH=305 /DNA_ID=CAMNT_0038833941 /DNA_START=382 /DNA_END=1299 /DNA_ORIENTATION=+